MERDGMDWSGWNDAEMGMVGVHKERNKERIRYRSATCMSMSMSTSTSMASAISRQPSAILYTDTRTGRQADSPTYSPATSSSSNLRYLLVPAKESTMVGGPRRTQAGRTEEMVVLFGKIHKHKHGQSHRAEASWHLTGMRILMKNRDLSSTNRP